jgi:putative ABC transport system substrate-binding protein
MRRRDFITGIAGSAATWPRAAGAQQRPAIPVIGFLSSASADAQANSLREFHRGLKETGYIEGENVTIIFRWAEDKIDRLPELADDLIHRKVAVIQTGGVAAQTAKAATTTIPIVFIVGEDPVRRGLVANLARPGGNLTGINFFAAELTAKRLELLHELVPTAKRIAALVNPAAASAEPTLRDLGPAARALGLQIEVHNAGNSREIDAAFKAIERARPDALFVAVDPIFAGRRVQIVQLATHYRLAASYPLRDFADIGGLMSYGGNIAAAWREAGVYVGRILKGEKPADLPVTQSTKFELVINHRTARMLGLTVPPTLLATANEVIE